MNNINTISMHNVLRIAKLIILFELFYQQTQRFRTSKLVSNVIVLMLNLMLLLCCLLKINVTYNYEAL